MNSIVSWFKSFYVFQNENEKRNSRYANASRRAKNYCYYSEDYDGNPTVCISGDNVFTIKQSGTKLDEHELSITDAVMFVNNTRKEYIKNHINDPIR